MQRNRVSPLGEIVATPLRGAWTGNRGCLHRDREIVRFHAGDLWIICALEFRGWHSELWRPGRFTWLFFHDEAVALAAGHRPCALCRRDSYNAYRDAVGGSATEINKRLHAERLVRGTHQRRFHAMPWRELPDGTFALVDGMPRLVLGDALVEWTTRGYGAPVARPQRGEAEVITPPSSVTALCAGYPVQIAIA